MRSPACLQLLGEVAGLHAAAEAGEEDVRPEGVAAGARHDVDRRPADFGFTESARRRDRNLLRVLDVLPVARDAAAVQRRAGIQAIDLRAAFVAAAAAATEHDHPRAQLHVRYAAAALHHRRDQHHETGIALGGRQRLHELAVQRALPSRALHVDDRALAGHRDRLLERADAQVGVDRRVEVGGQLQPFALEGAEPGQREGHGVRAGPQVDDAVQAVAVGDGGADFFDQRRRWRLRR